MKKLISVLISFLMVLSLASCGIVNITIERPGVNDGESTTLSTTQQPSGTSEQPASTTENVSSDMVNGTDNNNNNNTNNTNNNSNNDTPAPSLENVDNGVLKQASVQTMEVPKNMQHLGTSDATEENNSVNVTATTVLYLLDGDVVNWKTENDFIYVITSGNNRLVVLDSRSMAAVCNLPLAGEPAEMNIYGDKIYISFPDLCKIEVISKTTFARESSLYFDREVSSFCLNGDYIYYSEHDQHCKVFMKNLVTNQEVAIKNQNNVNASFYQPKLYLNKEDGILYVGETGITGSTLYYYDANSLLLKSMFKKNDYGIMNHSREIFHLGDEIFWGSYRLSDTNAKELVGKYGTADWGSMTFVSEDVVSTYEGLFLAGTYECIIDYHEAGFDFEYILISDSYNIFFRRRISDENIIIGVNFGLQQTLQPV